MSAYASSTKNIQFVLRTISTVGNYDYMLDYTFSSDGSMETRVRASGYIQSAFYAGNEEYGFRIKDGLSGSMHSHALTFKMDLDVIEENNTMAVHSLVPVEQEYPWSAGKKRKTYKLERDCLKTEDEGKINWPSNASKMYIVESTEKNPYGEPRGYRIFPGSMTSHLPIEESSNLQRAQS